MNKTYFNSAMNRNISHIDLLKAMYSYSVVLCEIYVCNLINHNTVYPTYMSMYHVRNMTFSALLVFA